jgi:hypothetical protein
MEDAEAVKQEKAGMPEFKKDITPLLDMQPLAEANPAPAAEEVKLEPGVKGREAYLRALRERCIPSVPVEAPAQPPEVDLEKSMAGVDLVGAMVDQATKDIDERLAPSSLRVSYSRTLVANIKKRLGSIAADMRALEESNPAIALGQVWEDDDGKRYLVSIYNSQSEDYNTLVELSPPYHVRRVWDAATPPRTMFFLGLVDDILGKKDVV